MEHRKRWDPFLRTALAPNAASNAGGCLLGGCLLGVCLRGTSPHPQEKLCPAQPQDEGLALLALQPKSQRLFQELLARRVVTATWLPDTESPPWDPKLPLHANQCLLGSGRLLAAGACPLGKRPNPIAVGPTRRTAWAEHPPRTHCWSVPSAGRAYGEETSGGAAGRMNNEVVPGVHGRNRETQQKSETKRGDAW